MILAKYETFYMTDAPNYILNYPCSCIFLKLISFCKGINTTLNSRYLNELWNEVRKLSFRLVICNGKSVISIIK